MSAQQFRGGDGWAAECQQCLWSATGGHAAVLDEAKEHREATGGHLVVLRSPDGDSDEVR